MPKYYIVGRTRGEAQNECEAYGKDIPGETLSLSQRTSPQKEEIRETCKRDLFQKKCLCILINNAGITLNTQQSEAKTAEEMSKNLFDDEKETFDMWTDTYRTNVPQIYFMTIAFLPLLQKATELQYGYSGTVINTSSISGIVKTSQHHFAYNASKAAAIHLTHMLANEIAGNGIKVRVNSIAPGVFPSEMTAGDSGPDQKSELPKEKYEKVTE